MSCDAVNSASLEHTRDVNDSIVSQMLHRYDESDMSQVHDLVTLFTSLNLTLENDPGVCGEPSAQSTQQQNF